MPRDPDDLDDVLGQVSDALDELEVVQGAERDALLDSLRGVLGALGELPVAHVEVRTHPEAAAPERGVSVIPGGRADDVDAGAERPRPDLRLAEAQEDTHDPDSAGPGAQGLPAALSAQVRLLRPRRPGRDDTLGEPPGQVRLAPPEPGARVEQPVFQGRRARTYRVRCVEGSLVVEADGVALPALGPGQTVDVEGRSLRVWATATSEGRYIRLRE